MARARLLLRLGLPLGRLPVDSADSRGQTFCSHLVILIPSFEKYLCFILVCYLMQSASCFLRSRSDRGENGTCERVSRSRRSGFTPSTRDARKGLALPSVWFHFFESREAIASRIPFPNNHHSCLLAPRYASFPAHRRLDRLGRDVLGFHPPTVATVVPSAPPPFFDFFGPRSVESSGSHTTSG